MKSIPLINTKQHFSIGEMQLLHFDFSNASKILMYPTDLAIWIYPNW